VPDLNRDLSDFLRRARAAVEPGRAGLPADHRVRRVPGLRREEVALLAGVSTDYYTRLEQGRRIVPSASVLDAIARALDLGPAGRRHLEDLVGPVAVRPSRPHGLERVRPGLRQLVDALDGQPALVLGRRAEILAANRMARALFDDFEAMPARERNYARWVLMSDTARTRFIDWEAQARAAVESLRLEAGRDPDDRGTRELVADLTERSAEFRVWWAQHRVHQRSFGAKRIEHPLVGALTVDYESFVLPADPEQTLFVYSARPGTASHQALDLLASWVASDGLRAARASSRGVAG
jgi:transcriptional regulator with XRE-family HTH domain